MSGHENIADFLRHLAVLAAAETLPRFRRSIAVDNKRPADFDPVTEADRAAERVLRAAIEDRFPEDGVDGEEYGQVRMDAKRVWVIDPIDGTRAFICGLPTWGTLVGLRATGDASCGLMSQPHVGETFIADGEHAVLERQGERHDLRVSGCQHIAEARVFTTDPYLWKGEEAEPFAALRHAARLTRYGADCYAFGLLAAGHADLVVETGLNSYDIQALIPIVQLSGGVIGTASGESASAGGTVVAAASQALYETACDMLTRR